MSWPRRGALEAQMGGNRVRQGGLPKRYYLHRLTFEPRASQAGRQETTPPLISTITLRKSLVTRAWFVPKAKFLSIKLPGFTCAYLWDIEWCVPVDKGKCAISSANNSRITKYQLKQLGCITQCCLVMYWKKTKGQTAEVGTSKSLPSMQCPATRYPRATQTR